MRKSPVRLFVREIILGRRGLIKLNSLWLPLGIAMLEPAFLSSPNPLLIFFMILAAEMGWSLAATFANDLSELAEDRASGKIRWIAELPAPAARAMPHLFAAAGLGALLFAGAPVGPVAAYAVSIATGMAYSVKPFRMKERGAWGLAVYAFSCAAAYAVLPWTWFGGGFPAIAVFGTAVFLDKWVNLHFHQIIDLAPDAALGIRTYAVCAGKDTARLALRPAVLAATLSLATAAACTVWKIPDKGIFTVAAAFGTLALAAFHAFLTRRRPDTATDLTKELPWYYLGLTLGVFRVLPLVVFWEIARRNSSLYPALAVVVLLSAGEAVSSFRYRYE